MKKEAPTGEKNGKKPRPVQLELFTMQPRPVKPASWPTPRGSCYRLLRAAVVREVSS